MKQLVVDNYVINAPIPKILETIKQELNGRKLKEIKVKGSQITLTCPSHNGGNEQNPSCGIYIGNSKKTEYGSFNCFTCGKHGSFVYFVSLCFDADMEFAKKWLIQHFGEQINEIHLDLEPIELKKKEKVKYLNESVLNKFQSYHPYMDKRKITKKVRETFKVKYDPDTQCLVFPVWDEQGRLWMLTRRSVNNKMFLIDKDKEKPVYLMNFIRKNNIREIVVCESQINALTVWGYDIPAVATFGCNVTDKQMSVFNKSNLQHIYLAFDGDKAGEEGTEEFLKNLRSDIFVDVIILPLGKDVNDLTREEFLALPVMSGAEWLKWKKDK